MTYSRRKLLKQSASGLAIGLTAVSGCLGRATDENGQSAVSIPDPSRPSYRRWLPEPSEVGSADHDHYRGRYYSLTELRSYPNRKLSTFHRERIRDRIGFLGIHESADELIGLSGVGSMRAYVVQGSYDGDEVAQTVRSEGFSDAGTHAGYDLFRRDDPNRAVAVSDETVVYGKQEDAVSLVEAIIDASRGNRPRYHEADETFASLTEAVGESSVTTVETNEPAPQTSPEILQFEGSVGHSTGRSVADGTEYVRHAIEFTERADDRVEVVRETVADDESFTDVGVFAEENTVFVEGERDPAN